MFGADVIRGYVAGRPFIAPYHWTARNRIGLCVTGQLGSDEVLAIGSRRGGWVLPAEWLAMVTPESAAHKRGAT